MIPEQITPTLAALASAAASIRTMRVEVGGAIDSLDIYAGMDMPCLDALISASNEASTAIAHLRRELQLQLQASTQQQATQ